LVAPARRLPPALRATSQSSEEADPLERARQTAALMRAIEEAYLYGVEGATELWLCRHGDCYAEVTVPDDPPLSAWGREQAARLGERLRRVDLAAVYASPSRRAVETAEAIGLAVASDERLREFGNDPQAAVEAASGAGPRFTEDVGQAQERIRSALKEIAEAHRGRRVAVVAHGGIILALLCDILRVEFPGLRLLPYYTSVTVVRFDGGRMRIGCIGDTAHLEPIGGPPTM
jgi:broad specificity phosphatase PhoE